MFAVLVVFAQAMYWVGLDQVLAAWVGFGKVGAVYVGGQEMVVWTEVDTFFVEGVVAGEDVVDAVALPLLYFG